MKKIALSAALITASGSVALAGGLDRSGQSTAILFEKGNYAELSFALVNPTASGNDVAVPFGGNATGDVLNTYSQVAFGYKQQLNDQWSLGLIVDQPFGANTQYPIGMSVALATATNGTNATINSVAVTGLVKYQLDQSISVFGGLRAQQIQGSVGLNGLAFGAAPPAGLNGYLVDFAADNEFGYVLGAAYEIPDIALRVALTYNSAITHKVPTQVLGAAVADTTIRSPESWNLEFQTGVAEDTLVFGGVRYVPWSKLNIQPQGFPLPSIASLQDTYTYSLGVGRRLNETWSVTAALDYERAQDPIVSPLAPYNGRMGIGLGAIYTAGNMKVTGGVRYTKLGNADPGTGLPAVTRANFSGSSSIALGLKVGYSF